MISIVLAEMDFAKKLFNTWLSPEIFLMLATFCLSDLQKLPSAMKHQSWSCRCKCRCYARYLRNFDRPLGLPGHHQWCFLCLQPVVRAISSEDEGMSLRQQPLPSAMKNQSGSLRRKFWTPQYLWNFDWPLGLPGHCRWCFWCRQHVDWAISSEDDGRSPWQLSLPSAMSISLTASILLPSVMEYQSHRLHFVAVSHGVSVSPPPFCCRQPWSISPTASILPLRGILTISHVHFAIHFA